jgi:Flp pilus assembly protein TadD
MRALAACLVLMACQRSAGVRAISTTRGDIAVGNLSAQIDGQERMLRSGASSVSTLSALVELLQARAQYTGSVLDFRRIAALGEAAVRAAPGNADALLARASSEAGLHRFTAALADLDAAGATPEAQSLRASVLQARGDLAGALVLRREAVKTYANTRTLGALAAAEGAAGEMDSAMKHFAEAADHYRDTSPLPLAWLDFQRGLLLERRGRFKEAQSAYEAATVRLPQYAQAQAHLAGVLALLGDRQRAAEILRPLAALDDPEYQGQLAALTQDSKLRDAAAQRYEALLGEFPEAFADHAARFYLPFSPGRALELARINLKVRETQEAYDLALSAASIAGVTDCALSARARAAFGGDARMGTLASRVCPDEQVSALRK